MTDVQPSPSRQRRFLARLGLPGRPRGHAGFPGRTRAKLGRRGSITGYAAVMLTTLIGFSGFAVDLQRAWLVQTRLKTAIDAAALAAARDYDATNRDTNARAAFTANVNPGGTTNAAFGASFSTPVIATEGTNAIRITATATVPKTLFRILASSDLVFTESSVATRIATGLELSIVLDATGSMSATDTAMGITKFQAAKNAIGSLLTILYGSNDTQNNLWVSFVPFTRSVNIGTSTAARALLNTTNPAMATGWDINAWSGCVEARTTTGNYDLNDAAPTTDAGKFRPFFWPSTFRQVGTIAGGNCAGAGTGRNPSPTQAYADGTCYGDNDWGQTTANLANNPVYSYYSGQGLAYSVGPNLFCSPNAILPLTASKATVQAAVTAATVPVKSGGTLINPGLHAGWLTLSPNWRGYWPGGVSTLPLDYNTRNMRKALILLSDGQNNWQGWTSTSPGVNPDRNGEIYYSAYGRAADQRITFTRSTSPTTTGTNASNALDTRLTTLCTNIKAAGVAIYVIGFEVSAGSSEETLLANCSSDGAVLTSPQYYFRTASASALQTSFKTIANRLASLRISE